MNQLKLIQTQRVNSVFCRRRQLSELLRKLGEVFSGATQRARSPIRVTRCPTTSPHEADGVVAFVKDGIPENVPQASGEIKPAVPITRETVPGNWISIDLGKNRYAFYAHLQPGSIRFKVGDKVRKGQVIGLLGNSGNAVGPHLHFHIGDAKLLEWQRRHPIYL